MNALTALGLELDIVPSREHRESGRPRGTLQALPESIAVRDFPQLRRIAWQRDDEARLTPGEALAFYGVASLTPLDMLVTQLLANADRWRDDSAMSRDLNRLDRCMEALHITTVPKALLWKRIKALAG